MADAKKFLTVGGELLLWLFPFMKGNYLDVPTDCPTRERAGWTGDAMVYCVPAAYQMDIYRFTKKWLADVILEQNQNGSIKNIVPDGGMPAFMDEAKYLYTLYRKVREAYQKEFLPSGLPDSDRQCRYVRPLALGLAKEKEHDFVSIVEHTAIAKIEAEERYKRHLAEIEEMYRKRLLKG